MCWHMPGILSETLRAANFFAIYQGPLEGPLSQKEHDDIESDCAEFDEFKMIQTTDGVVTDESKLILLVIFKIHAYSKAVSLQI